MIVHTDWITPSRDEIASEWYVGETHVPDSLRSTGFVAATRYDERQDRTTSAEQLRHRYVAVYEVPLDAVDAALGALQSANDLLSVAIVAGAGSDPATHVICRGVSARSPVTADRARARTRAPSPR